MNKLKVTVEIPNGYLQFYNKEKGIRDFIHSMNNILIRNQVPFRIYCEYEKVKKW